MDLQHRTFTAPIGGHDVALTQFQGLDLLDLLEATKNAKAFNAVLDAYEAAGFDPYHARMSDSLSEAA